MQTQTQTQVKLEPLLDRRENTPEYSVLWKELSLAQKFSASSLGKFGYELAFVRNEKGRNVAVLTCESGVVVITEDGDINTCPDIRMRD